jgi:hypothetical protein
MLIVSTIVVSVCANEEHAEKIPAAKIKAAKTVL